MNCEGMHTVHIFEKVHKLRNLLYWTTMELLEMEEYIELATIHFLYILYYIDFIFKHIINYNP